MDRPKTDAELLRRAARGDDDAFADFYRHYLPLVVGFHLRRTGRPELAFDLAAETFAAVVTGLSRFDPDRAPAAAWLFGIAKNKLAMSLRAQRVENDARLRLGREPLVLEDAALERITELGGRASEADLLVALSDLPESQRTALTARVINERPYAEIAAEMACSQSVVRQHVHRGLRGLRARLEHQR